MKSIPKVRHFSPEELTQFTAGDASPGGALWQKGMEALGEGGFALDAIAPSEEFKQKFPGATLRPLRGKDVLNSVTRMPLTAKNPYSCNIVKNKEQDWSFLAGSVEEINEEVNQGRQFRWNLEVLIGLSPRKRNRVVVFSLFEPFAAQADPHAFRRESTIQEHMTKKRSKIGRQAVQQRRCLDDEEHWKKGLLSPHQRDHMVNVNGAIRIIQDLCTQENVFGVPTGRVLIRVLYHNAVGIALHSNDLESGAHMDILRSWLHDIVDFSRMRDRRMYWSKKDKMFIHIPPSSDHILARHPILPMKAVHFGES